MIEANLLLKMGARDLKCVELTSKSVASNPTIRMDWMSSITLLCEASFKQYCMSTQVWTLKISLHSATEGINDTTGHEGLVLYHPVFGVASTFPAY